MAFKSKYCFRKQFQNGCSILFNKFNLRKEYSNWSLKKLRSYKDCIPRESVWKGNISRALSTQMTMKPLEIEFATEDKDIFTKFFPNIIKDITEGEMCSINPEVKKRFLDVLEYNQALGSYIVGLNVLTSYKMLEKPENLTKENIRLATVVSWCCELITISYLLLDDIMDNSEIRRNAPCWFKIEGIGLTAMHDILFLENSSYSILKKYLSSHPMYIPIMEYFREACNEAIHGQCLDIIKPKIEEITLDRYTRSVMYRNGCFYLVPTIIAMYLTNTYSAELHRNIASTLYEMGVYLQIENDMRDCFGDAQSGKIGTDIQEGKCTWPASIALQKVNSVQRKLMEDHYGKPEKKSIEIIRNLYKELDIPAEYTAYKEKVSKKLSSQISDIAANDAIRSLLVTQTEKLFNCKYE